LTGRPILQGNRRSNQAASGQNIKSQTSRGERSSPLAGREFSGYLAKRAVGSASVGQWVGGSVGRWIRGSVARCARAAEIRNRKSEIALHFSPLTLHFSLSADPPRLPGESFQAPWPKRCPLPILLVTTPTTEAAPDQPREKALLPLRSTPRFVGRVRLPSLALHTGGRSRVSTRKQRILGLRGRRRKSLLLFGITQKIREQKLSAFCVNRIVRLFAAAKLRPSG
jgi:hypothetical protein